MVRNGIKSFAGNFMLVWKHLLYNVVIAGVCLALFLWSFEPVVDRLVGSGWVKELHGFFEVFYTEPSMIAETFEILATHLYFVLFNDIGSIWGSYAISLFLLLVLPNFLYNIGEYVLGVLTMSRMTSLLNRSYVSTLISTLGRSTLYSLWKLLLNIPFFAILLGVTVGYGLIANNMNGAWLLLPVFVALVLLVLAFRNVFFIGFLPVAVKGESSVVKSFADGMDHYTDGYIKKVLLMWGLFIMEFGAVIMTALFTLGAGLILALPSVIVINVACSFTNYYATRKENYYVGENTIVKPL